MKVVLIIIGSLGGIYAIVGTFLFVKAIMTSDPGTAYGGANIAASPGRTTGRAPDQVWHRGHRRRRIRQHLGLRIQKGTRLASLFFLTGGQISLCGDR
jgi:hypothetical protein